MPASSAGIVAEIVSIDPSAPERAFNRCREVIRSGGVVVYPTETFYGLGADPRNRGAVKRLFEIKGRPADRPVLLLLSDVSQVSEWAAEITPEAQRLIETFWPGPLTIVFRARPHVMRELTAGTGAIGLRVPGSELTRRLLAHLGTALTGTSANVSGRPSPATAREAAEALGAVVDLILDGGRTPGGPASTVVDTSAGTPRLVREGAAPVEELRKHVRIEG